MFSNEGGETMPKPDYAFVAINGARTVLAPATSAIIPSVPYDFATGASFYSQTFANAATFTLAFGVVDLTDYNVTSALWFDNVQITPVPEPETYAMLLAGLGLMGMVSRKRKI